MLISRSSSNPQIAPRMVRTISNLHTSSLPRDVRLSDYDTTGEFVMLLLISFILNSVYTHARAFNTKSTDLSCLLTASNKGCCIYCDVVVVCSLLHISMYAFLLFYSVHIIILNDSTTTTVL